jgi:hypothetical protein
MHFTSYVNIIIIYIVLCDIDSNIISTPKDKKLSDNYKSASKSRATAVKKMFSSASKYLFSSTPKRRDNVPPLKKHSPQIIDQTINNNENHINNDNNINNNVNNDDSNAYVSSPVDKPLSMSDIYNIQRANNQSNTPHRTVINSVLFTDDNEEIVNNSLVTGKESFIEAPVFHSPHHNISSPSPNDISADSIEESELLVNVPLNNLYYNIQSATKIIPKSSIKCHNIAATPFAFDSNNNTNNNIISHIELLCNDKENMNYDNCIPLSSVKVMSSNSIQSYTTTTSTTTTSTTTSNVIEDSGVTTNGVMEDNNINTTNNDNVTIINLDMSTLETDPLYSSVTLKSKKDTRSRRVSSHLTLTDQYSESRHVLKYSEADIELMYEEWEMNHAKSNSNSNATVVSEKSSNNNAHVEELIEKHNYNMLVQSQDYETKISQLQYEINNLQLNNNKSSGVSSDVPCVTCKEYQIDRNCKDVEIKALSMQIEVFYITTTTAI